MANMLARGAAYLAAKRKESASVLFEYERRGRPSIAISLKRGRTTFEIDRGGMAIERVVSEDFIASPGDLLLESEPVLPEPGDLIYETLGAERVTYEVQSIGGEPCWRWCDSYKQSLRIHAKRIKSES